jgi:hypothetical protein
LIDNVFHEFPLDIFVDDTTDPFGTQMCEMAIELQGKNLILQFPISDIIQMPQSDHLKIFHGERFNVSNAKE